MILETVYIIIEQALLHFPLILGAYMSVSLMKIPDLSLESAYVFGALLATSVIPMVQTMSFVVGISVVGIIALLAGACVGAVSGMLTQYAHIPHLLSSIITIGIFHGISQLTAGTYVSLAGYKNILEHALIPLHPELPVLIFICAMVAGLCCYFFTTQLGYSYAVFGYNPYFFAHYGISSSFVFLSGIMCANSLAGLGGYLVAQSNGFADINMGFGKVLLCITALILGKLLYNKTLSIFPAMIGLLSYFTLQQLLLKVGFDLRYFTMIQASVILVILIVQYRKQRPTHQDHLGV